MPNLVRRVRRPGIWPTGLLCPASAYPGPSGPRSLQVWEESPELGSREPRCGRQQAGGQATTAGLAVVSVSKLVLRRNKGQCDFVAGGRAGAGGGWCGNFQAQREDSGVRPSFILALLPASGPW